jgi:dihydroorotase-like cyclic amidohydrolase
VQGKAKVDVAQWGGLVASNAHDAGVLGNMLRLGAVGLKGFMSPSGMDDFPAVSRRAPVLATKAQQLLRLEAVARRTWRFASAVLAVDAYCCLPHKYESVDFMHHLTAGGKTELCVQG